MLPFYYYHQLTIDCLLSTRYCVKHLYDLVYLIIITAL